jgi:hypothetical protein
VGAAPGGGAGGGALLIASSTRIAIGGEINARGGIGWSGSGTGGCGAGGGVRLVAPTCTGGGIVRVNGGINPGNSRVGDAESGRVRIEAFSHQFTNTEGNVTSFARPGLVFLPPNAPKVRVVSVVTAEGTIAIPPGATASYEMPDAVVNTTTPVTLNVAAENIPLGTTVTLRMVSETGALSVVTSGPLSGTTASSTATAGPFTLPTGFSRFSLAVSFAPQ